MVHAKKFYILSVPVLSLAAALLVLAWNGFELLHPASPAYARDVAHSAPESASFSTGVLVDTDPYSIPAGPELPAPRTEEEN